MIATISDIEEYELDALKTLNYPGDLLVVGINARTLSESRMDLKLDADIETEKTATRIADLLTERKYLPEYYL